MPTGRPLLRNDYSKISSRILQLGPARTMSPQRSIGHSLNTTPEPLVRCGYVRSKSQVHRLRVHLIAGPGRDALHPVAPHANVVAGHRNQIPSRCKPRKEASGKVSLSRIAAARVLMVAVHRIDSCCTALPKMKNLRQGIAGGFGGFS